MRRFGATALVSPWVRPITEARRRDGKAGRRNVSAVGIISDVLLTAHHAGGAASTERQGLATWATRVNQSVAALPS
jgi:hypothetical protein